LLLLNATNQQAIREKKTCVISTPCCACAISIPALKFYRDALGLKEVRRIENDKAKFTLVFLCAAEDEALLKGLPQTRGAPLVELTYNWDEEKYGEDRHFGPPRL